VLPLVERTAKALSGWLAPAWGEALELKADLDRFEALSGEREALWARLEAASSLTVDEKRAAIGYGPLEVEDNTGVAPEIGARVALKYSPEQPRVPAGNADGGQWTSGGGGGDGRVLSDAVEPGLAPWDEVSQASGFGARRYPVNLRQQDAELGGHTIRDHVGKSDEYLLDQVRSRTSYGPIYTYGQQREGTFLSEESANDLVNRSLERNSAMVDIVAAGDMPEAILDTRFGYVTGKEAYRPDADAAPYIRDTYAVRVVIRHDARSTNGFKVLTAFPINEKQKP
jgi:hypothetical protein